MNRRKFFEISLWGSVSVGMALKGKAVAGDSIAGRSYSRFTKPDAVNDVSVDGKRKVIKLVARDA